MSVLPIASSVSQSAKTAPPSAQSHKTDSTPVQQRVQALLSSSQRPRTQLSPGASLYSKPPTDAKQHKLRVTGSAVTKKEKPPYRTTMTSAQRARYNERHRIWKVNKQAERIAQRSLLISAAMGGDSTQSTIAECKPKQPILLKEAEIKLRRPFVPWPEPPDTCSHQSSPAFGADPSSDTAETPFDPAAFLI